MRGVKQKVTYEHILYAQHLIAGTVDLEIDPGIAFEFVVLELRHEYKLRVKDAERCAYLALDLMHREMQAYD
jgi:hypothetical protein